MFCSFTIIRPCFKVFTGAASVICCAVVVLHSIPILHLLRLCSELLRSPEVDITEDFLQLQFKIIRPCFKVFTGAAPVICCAVTLL